MTPTSAKRVDAQRATPSLILLFFSASEPVIKSAPSAIAGIAGDDDPARLADVVGLSLPDLLDAASVQVHQRVRFRSRLGS